MASTTRRVSYAGGDTTPEKDTAVPFLNLTLSPEDGSGTQVTIRLEVEDGVVRVAEYAARTPAGTSVASDILSMVDLERLVSAVRLSDAGADPSEATPDSRSRGARRPAPVRSTRTATPATQKSARTASPPAARAYRKLPDDLIETFEQIGSVTGLAAHYGVPRHTAQGWINRMRSRAAQ
jgi:hypothetical protein